MELSGYLHVPASLPSRKEPQYLLDKRLGGPQWRSGRCGEERSPVLPGIEAGRPAHRLPNIKSEVKMTESNEEG